MYAAIVWKCETDATTKDFDLWIFLPFSLTLFGLGQLLEWLVHLVLFPFSKFRARYEIRKKLLMVVILIITIGVLVSVVYLLHGRTLFIPFAVVISLMFCAPGINY